MTDSDCPSAPPPHRDRRDLAPLLAVALLTAIFFIPWLFQGKIFLAADILYTSPPWSSYVPPDFRPHNTLISDPVNLGYPAAFNRQMKEGTLKNWNPLVMAGLPAISSVSTGGGHYYFLKRLFHRFFAAPSAVMLVLLTHLLLMGAFMYLYLLDIGAGWRGALFGATAWMFSGCAMVWFEFEIVATAGAFIPALLLVMERFILSRRWVWACVGALVLGTYILTQHLQFLLYIGVILICYFFLLAWRLRLREPGWGPLAELVGCCAVTAFGALLIGAAELLPTAEMIANSSRLGRNFDFTGLFDTLGRVYYRQLVTLIFPDYFGSPVLGLNVIPRLPTQEYMNYNELCLYLGVPTLFALLAAAAASRELFTRFWLLLTALFASMMVGTYTFYPLFKWYPGLGKVNPTRLIFLFTLAATVSAGLGFAALDGLSRARRKVFLAGATLLAASVLVLAIISARPGIVAWFNSEYTGNPRWPAIAQALAGLRALSSPGILKPLLLTAGAFLLFGVLALVCDRRVRLALSTLILALLAYDLISFGWYYNTAMEPQYLYARTPAIDFIKSRGGVFRVVTNAASGFLTNSLAPFGIEELGGYANVYPERVNRLLSYLEFGAGGRFDRWIAFGRHQQWQIYNLLNVRYFLNAVGAPTPSPDLRLVLRQEIDVYENTRALPRAFVVHQAQIKHNVDDILRALTSPGFDPAATVILEEEPRPGFAPATAPPLPGKAEILAYSEDRIEVSTNLAANGWLVVSNTFYPGWEATTDGKPVPVQLADCALMAIPLAAGRHNVVLAYRPKSIARGKVLSLLGLLLCVSGMAVTVYLGRRRAARTSRTGDPQPPTRSPAARIRPRGR